MLKKLWNNWWLWTAINAVLICFAANKWESVFVGILFGYTFCTAIQRMVDSAKGETDG